MSNSVFADGTENKKALRSMKEAGISADFAAKHTGIPVAQVRRIYAELEDDRKRKAAFDQARRKR